MIKIYELDISLFDKIRKYPTFDSFLFTSKGKRNVIAVDNTTGDFFTEEFSNKTKGLIYLCNRDYLPNDVEKEYKENKKKYKNYSRLISNQNDYMFDRDLYDRDFLHFDPNKKYSFVININYKKTNIKATIKDALGLASNYEGDLLFNGRLIFSPLSFDWNYNNNLIHKYLGISPVNKNGINLPYSSWGSPKIEIVENSKESNLFLNKQEEKNIKI